MAALAGWLGAVGMAGLAWWLGAGGIARLVRWPGLLLVGADSPGAAAEQRDGAAGVAAVGVGQPDRDLGEPLPTIAFLRRGGLQRGLEDLLRVKRAPRAQQLIGKPGRVRPGEREVVGDRGHGPGGLGWGERTAERVTGTCIPRPTRGITIPRQRSGSGSASQPWRSGA